MNLLFNDFDYLLLAILLLSILIGIWRGFVKEALSFFVWIAAFILALLFSPGLTELLSHHIDSGAISNTLSFFAIFLFVLIVGKLVTGFVNQFVDRICGISLVNRLVGGCFGLARGVLIVLLVVFLVSHSPWQSRSWFHQSQIVLWSRNVVNLIQGKATIAESSVNISPS